MSESGVTFRASKGLTLVMTVPIKKRIITKLFIDGKRPGNSTEEMGSLVALQ